MASIKGKIISLVQLKGGVGRSTLATNIAGTLAESAKVALFDCDYPQFTCSHWLNQRVTGYEIDEVLDIFQPNNYRTMASQLDRLRAEYDYIVVDCPPRLDGYSKLALVASDLTLFPLGPSAAEIWSIEQMLSLIDDVKKTHANFDGRIVWNRFRGYTRSAQEQAKVAKKDLKLPEMRQKLGFRVSYSEAMSEGLTVHETDDKAARLEMWSLSSAIIRLLSAQKQSNKLNKANWLEFAKG